MTTMSRMPDFGAPLGAPDLHLFSPYEGDAAVLIPDGLEIDTLPNGHPDFQLTIARRPPNDPRGPWAALSLGLARRSRPEVALGVARAVSRTATLSPAIINDGWVRLVPAGGTVALPGELTQPTRLAWGLSAAHWAAHLDLDSGLLIKNALSNNILLLSAQAQVEILGIAPRLPVKVQFNPTKLVAAMLTMAGSSRVVAYDTLVTYFSRPTELPSLQVVPTVTSAHVDVFARAMAGRFRSSYATLALAPLGQDASYLEFNSNLDDGDVVWDLAQAAVVAQPWVFRLDPLDAARKCLAQSGAQELIHEFTADPLPLGLWEIEIAANLPAARQGLFDVGVNIEVPSRLPARPQAIVTSVELVEPNDSGKVRFRIAPQEQLQYVCKCYAVLNQNDNPKQIEAAPKPGNTSYLSLNVADFPVQFVVVDADAGILTLSTIQGSLSYDDAGTKVVLPFTLSIGAPRTALAMPLTAHDATLYADAVPTEPGASITLGTMPASNTRFSLASFPQCGPQAIDVTCRFTSSTGRLAVDLLAEALPESHENIASVLLSPDAPTSIFTYVALSPFKSGYRWRLFPNGAWSDLQPAGTPLVLDADALATKAQTISETINGIQLYNLADTPSTIYYVPGEPSPECGPNGDPTLLLLGANPGAILQLGAKWFASEYQLVNAQSELQQKHPELDSIQLKLAPAQVKQVVVAIGDGAGNWTPVANSTSSGFPPYNSIFNIQLDAANMAQAIAAIDGRADCLRVEFHSTLSPEIAAVLAINGGTLVRTSDISTWFKDGSGKSHVHLS